LTISHSALGVQWTSSTVISVFLGRISDDVQNAYKQQENDCNNKRNPKRRQHPDPGPGDMTGQLKTNK